MSNKAISDFLATQRDVANVLQNGVARRSCIAGDTQRSSRLVLRHIGSHRAGNYEENGFVGRKNMTKKSIAKAKVAKKVAAPNMFQFVRKRDGRILPFDQTRITEAILKALHASGEGNGRDAKKISDRVVKVLLKKYPPTYVLGIEEIQDSVENALILLDYAKTAKAYILYRKERERLREARKEVPVAVKQLVTASKKYFKNPLAEFVYYRTYSHWIEEEGRRETWIETVQRYMDFMKENLGDKFSEKEYGEVHEAILNQQAMPSMRLLQFAGKAARKTNVAAYNCSFIAPTRFEDFAEIVYISMCGTGVGFSVEHQNVEKLPQIERQTGEKLPDYVIEDSKEGWADALLFGMKTWFAGKDVTCDYSRLRAAGMRLKTMGGRSSGPAPLRELLDFTRRKILAKQGRRLSTLDVHDIICKIGEIVVSGGVRRSALISLSDLDDPEMRDAKKGQFYLTEGQRSLANNSAVYNEKPTAAQFLDEWVALAKSGTGERGIFNRGGLAKMLPKRRIKALKGYLGNLGTNPCGEIVLQSRQFCVGGDTTLITEKEIIKIKDVVNEKVKVWNGEQWSEVIPRITRKNQKLVRVYFGDGSRLDCTPDHRFSVKHRFQDKWQEVQAKDLMNHSRYSIQVEPTKIIYDRGENYDFAYDLGVVVGDGHIYNDTVFIDLYGPKNYALPIEGVRHSEYLPKGYNVAKVRVRTGLDARLVMPLRTDAAAFWKIAAWSRTSILNFVAGLIDADGSVTEAGGVRLYVSEFERASAIQLLLTKCGIKSSVNLLHKAGTKTNLGVRKKDLYYLQITDARDIPCKRVNVSGGHLPRFKGKYQVVKGVVPLPGLHDVYCFNEPLKHKALFGNVLTYQCNLSEVVARPEDTEATLLQKARIATIVGTYQSTLTNFGYLSKEWKKNCEAERLLGVSVTGQWDCPASRKPETLRKMRDEAIRVNEEYAKRFGVGPSTCITCVKPSGNLSQTVDASSGMHTRYAKYYIRRVRISATDSLFKMLKDQKLPYHPEVGQSSDTANTYVLEFPVKAPEGAATRNDMTALQQLEHWKMVKTNYTEHNPSVTIYVADDEWIAVANWLYNNWEYIGGLSFLPKDNHVYDLAPYEEITEERYNELIAKFPDIDFSQIFVYEKQDETEAAKELACVAGVCEIT